MFINFGFLRGSMSDHLYFTFSPQHPNDMHLPKKPSWHISENEVTPEHWVISRRDMLAKAGLGIASLSLGLSHSQGASAGFPTERNPKYNGDGLELNTWEHATECNNFYEFGFGKGDPVKNANKGWDPEPWTIEVGGKVKKPGKFDVNDLVKEFGIEQRVYRFRCVEAWSMIVPWDGFPLSKLLSKVEPENDATYVRFVTGIEREHMVGVREAPRYPWPYREGLRMDEAMHDLTLMVTGMFGKPLPNQNGAPIRLMVPWKYGFKSIKTIQRIEVVSSQPGTLWNELAPREYGFYANVNPEVSHPRWSQARERVLGSGFFDGKVPTLMFNGYEEEVAGLYQGMDLRRFY